MMPSWRRTLAVIWVVQLFSNLGYSFVVPFLPYFLQELGVEGVDEVAAWTAAVTSVMAISLAAVAPVWGVLGDRYGRKVMVIRATFSGAILMGLVGFVTSPYQLFALRLLQGLFIGTVPACAALIASVTPREHSGMALGSLQTAIFLGSALGPVIGGPIGDTFGYRASFWITAVLLFVAGVLVVLFAHEEFHPATEIAHRGFAGYRQALGPLLASGALVAVIASRGIFRLGTLAFPSMLPLFIQSILHPGAPAGTITGLVTGASALGSALGAPLVGRASDRLGHRRLLIWCGAAGGLTFLPQALVHDPWSLAALQFAGGFAIGGMLATLTSLLAHVSPRGFEGAVFGLDSTAMGAAMAAAPIAGAVVVTAIGVWAPFILTGILLLVSTLIGVLLVRESEPPTEAQSEAGSTAGQAGVRLPTGK